MPALSNNSLKIDEIFSSRLPFVVRWGTVIFVFILLLLASFCWFIEYPDIVTGNGTLNSVNAPRKVITKTEGRIVSIAVNENEVVQAGQVLAYMESTANPLAVNSINIQIDSIFYLINKNRAEETLRYLPTYGKQQRLENLGELQPAYQTFTQAFIQYNDILNQGYLRRKKAMLLTDLKNIQRMSIVLGEQRALLSQDLNLSNKTFESNKALLENKVIASLDYRIEKSKLLAKQLTLPQIRASIISNEGVLNAKKEEIAELDNQIRSREYDFIQALRTIKSQIQTWEYKYVLKAPLTGSITFIGFFQENQEMKIGQSLFYIQPENSSYFIEITIPQYNFGKVKVGQQVALKFQAYPYEQYGVVLGEIEYIDSYPTDSGYLAKVILPKGLQTNENKTIHFQQGLLAQADIVTEDMRLLKRFYYVLSKQLRI